MNSVTTQNTCLSRFELTGFADIMIAKNLQAVTWFDPEYDEELLLLTQRWTIAFSKCLQVGRQMLPGATERAGRSNGNFVNISQ